MAAPGERRPRDRRPDLDVLLGMLRCLAEHVSVPAIDTLWIFQPRRAGTIESTVVVLSAFESDGERRRVFTARAVTHRDREAQADDAGEIVERGAAPAERIGRLIDGVLRRLEDDLPEAPPRVARVRGDADAWADLLDDLAQSGEIRYQ